MTSTTNKKTSLFDNILIWFGAGISIAEIMTGTYLAELGFTRALLAIITGHIIGCAMLFLAGLIGGQTGRSSMETVKSSFGNRGGIIFALLNILQLLGWTAIMIYDGASAAEGLVTKSGVTSSESEEIFSGFSSGSNDFLRSGLLNKSHTLFAIIIGSLIILWIVIGITNLGKINTIAMAALFILTLILCYVIFIDGNPVTAVSGEGLSFGAAVELSAAMPISWLPLISDYTREAQKPVQASLGSTLVYGLISCWMYVIGMGAALLTGENNISGILLRSGLGIAGLIIVILSTVTTTFLDAWSAGISGESVFAKINGKYMATGVTVLGTIGAVLLPMDDITDFLYLIGSVFAPMIAVQIADYFILKKDNSERSFNVANLIIWAVGFIIYRLLMKVDIPVGNTLPDMAATILMCVIVNTFLRKHKQSPGQISSR